MVTRVWGWQGYFLSLFLFFDLCDFQNLYSNQALGTIPLDELFCTLRNVLLENICRCQMRNGTLRPPWHVDTSLLVVFRATYHDRGEHGSVGSQWDASPTDPPTFLSLRSLGCPALRTCCEDSTEPMCCEFPQISS